MKRRRCPFGLECGFFLAAFVIAGFVPVATGGEERDEEREERRERWAKEFWVRVERAMDSPMSFHFVGTPIKEAAAFLQGVTGLTVIVDPRLPADEAKVTIKIENIPLYHALRWLSLATGFEVRMEEGAIFFSADPVSGKDTAIGKIRLDFGPIKFDLEVRDSDLPREMKQHLVRMFIKRTIERAEPEGEFHGPPRERRRGPPGERRREPPGERPREPKQHEF